MDKEDFMLAGKFKKGMNPPRNDKNCLPPEDWLASLKFDGYRARYMGKGNKVFLSRQQKVFNAPDWFRLAMPPKQNLDGELWTGRNDFQSMGVVRKKEPDPKEWIKVKYIVYDLPDAGGTFEERYKLLKGIVKNNNERWGKIRNRLGKDFQNVDCPIIIAKQTRIRSQEHLDEIYEKAIKMGDEGIMLKDPKSLYEDGRSNYMLKVKPSFDEEAMIIDYKGGKGKYTDCLGGFVCKQLINMDTYHLIDKDEKHEFTISGMDDEVRHNYKETHPIGTVITYEHSGKTESGKPRFARYLRKRDEVIVKDEVDCSSLEKRDNLIHVLKVIADYEKANGEVYKTRAYMKVISSLNNINDDSELTEQNLTSMNGIGKSIYEKINFILKTGTCPQYDMIQKLDDPRKLFLDIHGVGPQAAKNLVSNGFKTIEDLRKCGNLSDYLNEKQILGLKYYEHLMEKIPKEEIRRHEIILKKLLQKVDRDAELMIAGSYRREKLVSGDIDVLMKSTNPETYVNFVKGLTEVGYLTDHLALGRKKYNGVCKLGKRGLFRRIDIMYTTPQEYPFAILYFTGSGEFNKVMRQKILDKGMTINEYGLKNSDTKQLVLNNFNEEKDIFKYLEFEYVEPKDRM